MLTRGQVGCIAAALAAASAIILVALAFSTPTPHPMHAAGARAVSWRWASGGFGVPWDSAAVPPPSTSLHDLRCQVWQSAFRNQCPDDITLAQRIWSGADESPNRLYVPWSDGSSYTGPGLSSINLEYQNSNRTIVIHECEARPLFFVSHTDSMPGAQLARSVSLLVVDTAGVTPGPITVEEDFWIQRITGDEANGDRTLGTVEMG